MALILRYCISSQKKLFAQEFRLFHHNVSSHTYINSSIKKCGSFLHTKHFSTEDERIHIYTGSLNNRVHNLKLFSYSTTIVTIVSQPFIYVHLMQEDKINFLALFAFMNITAAVSPLLVHWLTRRYVTNMYYYPKEDKYLAEVYGLFMNKKEIIFTSDEVDVPEIDSMLKCCSVHGHPLLFEETHFTAPKYYCDIMGYNDPIDFEMGPATATEKVDTKSTHENLIDDKEDCKRIKGKQ